MLPRFTEEHHLLEGPQATTVYTFVKTNFEDKDEFGALME